MTVMIYVMGIFGFIGGFAFGMMMIHFLLRHKTREELLSDKSIKWKFGFMVWATAVLGAYSFIQMYDLYF